MALSRFSLGLGVVLLAGVSIVACADDTTDDPDGVDPGADAASAGDSSSTHDGGSNDDATTSDAGTKDSGSKDAGSDAQDSGAEDADAAPPDLPPGVIIDLAGTAESHVSVNLTWTSPVGVTSEYDVRYAATPITTEADFLAATVVVPPAPLPPGTKQTANVPGLTPETTYHFVVRAKDGGGVYEALSNDVAVTTSGRATLLISEIAFMNTAPDGDNFVELVATKAGSVAGLDIRPHFDGAPFRTLAPLDVAVGDRIVVHASGMPGPANFAQEDETKSKASSTATNASPGAYDVYSDFTAIDPSGAITIMDGDAYMDAVAYSGRSSTEDDSTVHLAYDAFLAKAGGAWTLSMSYDDDDATICNICAELANGSGNDSPTCGGWPGFITSGMSLQRNGVVDTNTAADFFGAPQTRGTENAMFCSQETAKVAVSEVNPRAGLLELNVLQGGRLRGFSLRTNPATEVGAASGSELLALPDVCAATGDVVVVHLGTNATPTESTAKDQHLHAMYPSYYDTAWDFVTLSTLTFASSVVLAVRNPASLFTDAAAFSDQTTATTGDYVASLRYLQENSLWLPADCGGQLCGGATVPTSRAVAADWSLVDATSSTSAKRNDAAFPSQASFWSTGASSFGE
jgi:hypothetical protein